MDTFLMALVSFLVCVAFCIYVYAKDKVEKEPITLLATLFLAGGAAYILSYYIENIILNAFDSLFFEKYTVYNSLFGTRNWTNGTAEFFHRFLCAFLGIAVAEELFKWLVLFFITFRNKNFNCYFDGVVYSVFVSAGFALGESIRFAIANSWNVFIGKLVISLPVHMLLGIITGFLYTSWHTKDIADRAENKMIKKGVLKYDILRKPVPALLLSIFVPVLIHTVYAYVSLLKNDDYGFVFYAVSFLILCGCFIYIRVFSGLDRTDNEIADTIISQAHKGTGETAAPSSDYDGRPENGEVD